MSASRFECPRCQTVFVKDIGGDAAFVECPSCGALALPAGDATEGDLSRALSGPQNAPNPRSLASTEAEQPPAPSDPAAPAPGLFSALLEDAHSGPGSGSGDGVALPMGAPAKPMAIPAAAQTPLGPTITGSAKAPELDFNLGDLDLDFPAPPATSPGRPNPLNPTSGRGGEMSSPFSSQGPAVNALPPDALAALAADADAGPTNQQAPFSNTLSEEAFGDLEKAFDEMALRPQTAAPRGALSPDEQRFLRGEDSGAGSRSGSGAGSAGARRPPPLKKADGEERTAPPLPPGASGRRQAPPLKNQKKEKRPTHFELTAEAKKLAFLPINGERAEGSASAARPRMAMTSSVAVPRVERIDRTAATTQARSSARDGAASASEDTDFVRTDKKRERKTVPSVFHGLSVLRAAAIVIVTAILGGVGGAFTAPPPKIPNTPRARAELKFGEGNQYYDAGRYDDALGAFRGATSIDSTFALAHRAKGAALAKLNRHDEAAQAYEEYLKLETNALDWADVEAAIARREGRPPRKPEPPPAPTGAPAGAPPGAPTGAPGAPTGAPSGPASTATAPASAPTATGTP